jgi:GNAT superfamily N-acetyltransferase
VTSLPEATTFALRDGRKMVLRPLLPDDREEHRAFVERLSLRSSRFRFFAPLRRLEPAQQERYFDLDWVDRVALVACFPGERAIRAVGRYSRESPATAEVAFVVEDALQGQGIGRTLLFRLAEIARANGISRFSAWVLADNHDMLNLFRSVGWPMEAHIIGGIERVELQLPGAGEAAVEAAASRPA